ncbi:unnamed protein product, partial [marine sediment metagenome]
DATDGDGIREVKLYLNGLILDAEEKASDPYVWSGSSDELLKTLKPGMYHLEAVAEDNTGVRSQQEIQIAVGNVSENSSADWRDEIHQVILNEGERLMPGDVREFPRLECYFTLEDEGRLALFRGTPGRSEGLIWKTRGKADRPTPQPTPPRFYTVLENGQLVVYRGTPDNPEVILWKSSKPSGPGPYKLGITASRRLVIFSEVGEKRKIIWRSPAQD